MDIFRDVSRPDLNSETTSASLLDDDEDGSVVSAVDDEEDEEAKIKRQMMYAIGGSVFLHSWA